MLWILFLISAVFGNRLYDLSAPPLRRSRRRLSRYPDLYDYDLYENDEYAVGEEAPAHSKRKHRNRQGQGDGHENQVSGILGSLMGNSMGNTMNTMATPMAPMANGINALNKPVWVTPTPNGCPKKTCKCNSLGSSMMTQGGMAQRGGGLLGSLGLGGRRRLVNPPRNRLRQAFNNEEEQVGYIPGLGGVTGAGAMNPTCQVAYQTRCQQMCMPCSPQECQGFPMRTGVFGRRNLLGSLLSGAGSMFDRGYDCRLGWCRQFCKKTNGAMPVAGAGMMPNMAGGSMMPNMARTGLGGGLMTETQLSDPGRNDYAEEYGRANRRPRRRRKDYDSIETAVGEPYYYEDEDDLDNEYDLGDEYDVGTEYDLADEYDVGTEYDLGTEYDFDHPVEYESPEAALSDSDDRTLEDMIQELLDSEDIIKHSLSNHRRARQRQRD